MKLGPSVAVIASMQVVNHQKYICVANVFALGYARIFSSVPRPLGAAYVPILLSEVEQEQIPSSNGDREAIVVGAGLRDGEGERAYIVYDLILGGEKLVWCS